MCKVIRENLKAAQSRQKSYYDSKHRDLAFEIGDHVYLRVSPMKGTRPFSIKGKLSPRSVGPFKIIGKRGDLANQLELPSNFANVHDVFHVSQLRKCFKTPDHTINFEEIDIQEDLSYHEHPVAIPLQQVNQIPQSEVVTPFRPRSHLGARGPPPFRLSGVLSVLDLGTRSSRSGGVL